MRLFKIKNGYLYDSDNPKGTHTYAVYQDKKTKENRAVALTHLYVKDNKRFRQVKKGNIAITKFKEFDVPSGVQNYYYGSTKKGRMIDLKDSKNVEPVSNRYLGKKQSNFIKKFAKNRYFGGKRQKN